MFSSEINENIYKSQVFAYHNFIFNESEKAVVSCVHTCPLRIGYNVSRRSQIHIDNMYRAMIILYNMFMDMLACEEGGYLYLCVCTQRPTGVAQSSR